MKKLISILIISFFIMLPAFAKKKEKPVLTFSPLPPGIEQKTEFPIETYDVFKINSKIYFSIYNPKGFKTDFIRYQIVKQDDAVEQLGFSRIRNITVRLKDKYYFSDYFVLTQTGKYFLQIFDSVNLHQWVAIGAFRVVEE